MTLLQFPSRYLDPVEWPQASQFDIDLTIGKNRAIIDILTRAQSEISKLGDVDVSLSRGYEAGDIYDMLGDMMPVIDKSGEAKVREFYQDRAND